MESNQTVLQGLHYRTGEQIEVRMQKGLITYIQSLEQVTNPLGCGERKEYALPMIGPGLVELQLNGYRGMDFNTIPFPDGTTGGD
ncbi:MAG: N-acetylglucosamine-6-phosphate deacetylase [Paenibacillus sp.]|jgi:N-acetylglucosamine-6-phosphate deacetylase|nr:N-acetylglucosamine-6-phosphate deacetylase [Paenibacillus sp.]